MSQPLTIDPLDAATMMWIQQQAQQTGTSIAVVVRHLIYRGIEIERQRTGQQRYHDLDSLAGTWSEKDATEFQQAIEQLDQIDPGLWQ
jgi:hypothetical protein